MEQLTWLHISDLHRGQPGEAVLRKAGTGEGALVVVHGSSDAKDERDMRPVK